MAQGTYTGDDSDYLSTDPYAGAGDPNPFADGNQSPAQDQTAAKWKIGDAIPAGYETFHPFDNPAKLGIRPKANGATSGAPPVPGPGIKIGDTQTGSDGQTYTWNGKTWTGGASAATGTSASAGPYSGDPTNVDTWLQWLAQQPGHDPILDTPQGQAYYKQRIGETGGLNANNLSYWQNKGTLAANGGAVGAPEGGSLINKVPTLADLQNMPGYQAVLKQGLEAIDSGAAAKGTLLTGGNQKDRADYAETGALQSYLSLANLGVNVNNSNANNLYNLASLGLTGSSYGSQ